MQTVPTFSLPPAKKPDGKATVKQDAERITLHCGTEVSTDFYNRNKEAALLGIRKMQPGQKWTFRKICGEAHWLTLDVSETSLAGLCGVTMAKRDELRLDLAGKDDQHAQLYVLK